MQRYKYVQASFYSDFFTSRYPYVQCKYHIKWTIDIYLFRRTPRYCTWYLYHFRNLNKWNWQKNMDHLIRYISEKNINTLSPYCKSEHMHNFVDLFYAYCMPLKSISTRKTCILSSPSIDWCRGPTELVRSSSLVRGVHMGATMLQDI
jgi:hypothetical protein